MNYLTLLLVGVTFVGCSNPNEVDQVNKIPAQDAVQQESRDTIFFEGRAYLGKTDSTYLWEEGFQNCSELIIYPNGQIKRVYHQGEFATCGMAVGIHKKFDSTGILLETIEHKNWLPDSAQGCHETIQEKYIVEYFQSGGIKTKKMFQNGYEEGEEHKTGVWQEFDEDGKLISSKNYGLKYRK